MQRSVETVGYSRAWLHHKGRNKHHYEYWIDISNHKEEGLVGNKMPLRYVAEMVCDRIAACEVYKGKAYTSAAPVRILRVYKELHHHPSQDQSAFGEASPHAEGPGEGSHLLPICANF